MADVQSDMTPGEFIFWLNGVVDLLDSTPPTQAQWDLIRGKCVHQVGQEARRRMTNANIPYPTGPDLHRYYAAGLGASALTAQSIGVSTPTWAGSISNDPGTAQNICSDSFAEYVERME